MKTDGIVFQSHLQNGQFCGLLQVKMIMIKFLSTLAKQARLPKCFGKFLTST